MRIAGERVAAIARRSMSAIRYTNDVVATVPNARRVDDIRRAFSIARAYKPTLTRYERSEICRKAATIIRVSAEPLSDLITAECGICKKDSLYEVGRARDVLRVRRQCGAAGRRPGVLVRPDAARQVAQGLHAARAAARRHLRDHAVQPSAEPGGAQDRAGDRDQQPDGAEADREDAAVGACARRHPVRGRPAAADAVDRDRRPARDRRRDARQSGRRPRHVHRRRRRRQVHRRRRPCTSGRCSSSAATIRSS